jgi:FO synthase
MREHIVPHLQEHRQLFLSSLPSNAEQEVIIQNFRAKQGTAMAASPEPPLSELLWTVALARLLLGPQMSIQAPPNLTPEPDDVARAGGAGAEADPAAGWRLLLDAGINDWGGGWE